MDRQDAISEVQLWRQIVQRAPLLRVQSSPCKLPCEGEVGVVQLLDPAIVVASDGRQCERLESLEGFPGPQRAGDAISQIDGGIDAAALDVGKHCFQSTKISVDVR